MIAANQKIIVSVQYNQKDSVNIGEGGKLLLAKEFTNNRRESMPVICHVEVGNDKIKKGEMLLVHHSRFVSDSPHHLGENLFSLACNSAIFARISQDGEPTFLFDNIYVDRFAEASMFTPPHLRKVDKHKFHVKQSGFGFKKGQTVFAFEFSDYEIVYVFKGKEYRVVKIAKGDIVGKISE